MMAIAVVLGVSLFAGTALATDIFSDETVTWFGGDLSKASSSFGDFNNDGYVDMCHGGDVYEGDGSDFTDNGLDTNSAAIWGDYNNDGYADLFTMGARLDLHTNDQDETWTDDSAKITSWTTNCYGAAWVDLDNDTYLDLYVSGYESGFPGTTYTSKVLMYDSSGSDYDAVWDDDSKRTRGVNHFDVDRDGDQDIYTSNYRLQANDLYLNDGEGNLTNVASTYGATGGSGHSIGSCIGDFNNDGYLDIFAANFAHQGQPQSRFLSNDGPGGDYHFTDEGTGGVAWQESIAAPSAVDYDNDGYVDIFITVAYNGDYSVLYHNDGDGGFNFTDTTVAAGLDGQTDSNYQNAWADVDNDGDMDLMTFGKMWINDSQDNGNHYLKVALTGNSSYMNLDAMGAQVRVYDHTNDMLYIRQRESGTGQASQNDPVLHYGLGTYSGDVDILINWPNGTVQSYDGVSTDARVNYTFDTDFINVMDTFTRFDTYAGTTDTGGTETFTKIGPYTYLEHYGTTINNTSGITDCKLRVFGRQGYLQTAGGGVTVDELELTDAEFSVDLAFKHSPTPGVGCPSGIGFNLRGPGASTAVGSTNGEIEVYMFTTGG